jgi:hypothetical protein
MSEAASVHGSDEHYTGYMTSSLAARRARASGPRHGAAVSRIASVTSDVESARRDWEDAYRRFEEASRDGLREERLRLQLRAVTEELRKRVGSTFTLGELAAEYRRADAWAYDAVDADELGPQWLATLTIVEGAAFRLYARGAVDYSP